MRNPALEELDGLVGSWDITLSGAWFLESMETEQHGTAVARWLGEAFLELTAEMEGEPVWHFVFGRSDVSIKSVWQEGFGDDAQLVFVTHRAREGAFQDAVAALRALPAVEEVRSVLRVEAEE